MIAAMLLLQATTADLYESPGNSFDLAALPQRQASSCASRGSEIVVCARRREPKPYRAAAPADAEPLIPRAEFGLIGKARMSVDGEHANVGGFATNRAMVRLKVPF